MLVSKYRPYLTSYVKGRNDYINAVCVPVSYNLQETCYFTNEIFFIKKAYIPYPYFCTIKIIFQILLLQELHSFAVLYHLSYETFSNEREIILININLFLLQSFSSLGAFVLTQAPLPETKVDLWTLCVDHDVKAIVILSEDNEVN